MKKIELPQLNYSLDSLEPFISKKTMEFHYLKHHKNYVDKLNSLIENTEFENKNLDYIVKNSKGSIFNNAAQVWNHSFFWECMSKNPSKQICQKFEKAVNKRFGTMERLKEEFIEKSLNLFGSGWTWLVKNDKNELEILTLPNAENPICQEKIPLLVCDLWEHAYYLDKQNKRIDYLKDFCSLIDWQKVANRYKNNNS